MSNRVWSALICGVLLFCSEGLRSGVMIPPTYAITINDVVNISNSSGSSLAEDMTHCGGQSICVIWTETTGGQTDAHLAISENEGTSFSLPINLTQSEFMSSGAKVASSGENVFVVWFENSELYLIRGVIVGGAVTFDDPLNLSNNSGDPRKPRLAASGNDVYVVWEDDSLDSSNREIFFVRSNDTGQSFSNATNLSDNIGDSQNPRITLSQAGAMFVAWQDETPNPGIDEPIMLRASLDGGMSFGSETSVNSADGLARDAVVLADQSNNVYLIWGDPNGDIEIYFSKGTVNTGDATVSFDSPVNVSNNTGFSFLPQMAISDSGVLYVSWIDDISGGNDVLMANSTDGGLTFSSAISVSSGANVPPSPPQLVILDSNGEDLIIAWQDGNVGGNDIFFSEITNEGLIIGDPINLSNNDGVSRDPRLLAFDDNILITWTDSSNGNNEVVSRVISQDGEVASISVESVSDESPKWGSSIAVSGFSNGKETDSITIDWGDGSFDPVSVLEAGTWGPIDHTYNASATGTNQITAHLFDSEGTEKATSAPKSINIIPHETVLSIDSIPSVVIGGDSMTVAGMLVDIDEGIGIGNRTITFGGSGSGGLSEIETGSGGHYSLLGSSPQAAGTLWTVQATFAGDFAYAAASSETRTFNTASITATQFQIPSGVQTAVVLEGYNASIMFDNVAVSGLLFVSECETPESNRYLGLDRCLTILSSAELAADSYAHVSMSFANVPIPGEHSIGEIDMFYETLSGFIDISEARSTGLESVTGGSSEFGRFVIGVALHDSPNPGSLTHQVFVGENQEVEFNQLSLVSMTFDSTEYSVGDAVPIIVEDSSANSNPLIVETLTINLTSESDSRGILLTLTETGNDTAVFTNFFMIDSLQSSTEERLLRVSEGDTIKGTYLVVAVNAPFKIIFDEVIESGLVVLSNFTVVNDPPNLNFPGFEAIGNAYTLSLIDAGLGQNSEMTIVMSYANVRVEQDEVISPDFFKLLWLDPDSPPPSFEWLDITHVLPDGGLAIDNDDKTVTGVASFPGTFTIGHDVRDLASNPGRGGGGIPRPGTGILLDATANVAVSEDVNSGRSSGGGSGGGGSRSTSVSTITSGKGVETSIHTTAGIVTIKFESVADTGQVKVNSSDLILFEAILDGVITLYADNSKHDAVRINGVTFVIAGEVYDIDASSVNFDGSVAVTIPYDEQVVKSFSNSESHVKFIHYNENSGAWEDITSSVDTGSNTVTGILSSLSPVTAALILDTSVPHAPGIRVSVPSLSLSNGGSLEMTTALETLDSTSQSYVMIVQLIDEMGIVQHLDWEEGGLGAGKITEISRSWSDLDSGKYIVKIHLISDMQNPWLLSQAQAEYAIQ